jgi:mannose-6-phosphate isomerase-like protein (cupin superfamily)
MSQNSEPTQDVFCHSPGEDEPIRFIGDVFTIKAQSSATGGAYSVTEMTVSPEAEGPPLHHHTDCEEAFYIIDGELEFEVDGTKYPAPSDSFLVVPRGAKHGYINPTREPARVLVLISPPGFEEHFREMGERIE